MTTSIAEVVLQLDCIQRVNEQLEGENAALRAAIARIQDLHEVDVETYSYGQNVTTCDHCDEIWPCPTITAIGKTP